ncbi:hypothetical protein GCM10020254_11160 [Streptomyces goshikiensis]
MSGTRPGTYFSLLGPVQAHRDDSPLPLGPPQQRALLAMLLCRRNAVVGLDELIDGLWGGEPPRSAVGTVRSYAYRLRRVLGGGIFTHGRGYALQVGPGELDLTRFDELTTRARAHVSAGDPEAARDRWRGPWRCGGGPPSPGCPARRPASSASGSPNCGCRS